VDEGIGARAFPERGAGQSGGLPRFLGNERGFTLIELLVVIT
jgi:type II secretory pathway pseudopilin PulG